MLNIKIKIDPTITVAKRDGSECIVDMTKIPESFFADFVTDGVAEYIRDSSSSALANAFDVAHPDHKHEGKALIAARNVWVTDNVDAVAKESAALMTDARDRLFGGERRVVRTSTVDPLDQWRIKVLRAEMRTDNGKAMKSAHDAIDSGDTKARREYLLSIAAKNVDWIDPKAIALRAASELAASELASGLSSISL